MNLASIWRVYWPESHEGDRLLIAGRRLVGAFSLTAGLVVIGLNSLMLEYFAEYPLNIGLAYLGGILGLFTPFITVSETQEVFTKRVSVIAIFFAVLCMMTVITSRSLYMTSSLYFVIYTMLVTLILGLRWGAAMALLAICTFTQVYFFGDGIVLSNDKAINRYVSLIGCVIFVWIVSGTFRGQLLQAADDLEKARAAAENANMAKSTFLAKMSHEIRTPMNGVVGLAELLARSDLADDQQRHALTIQRSGEGLLKIIDEILDFSRIEAGMMAVESKPFSPGQVLEDVEALLRPKAVEKNLELRLETVGEACSVQGDPLRFGQILINLIGNAIKFTESGHISVRLAIERREELASLNVVISDTGIGIPPGQHPHIFSAFTQADESTTRKFGGTGLGLAISRELARKMGGDLKLISSSRTGSVFRLDLRLPIAEDLENNIEGSPEHFNSNPLADEREHRLTVLVADDVEVNRLVVDALLDSSRYEAVFACNGLEAVNIYTRQAVDIVLMDISMPKLDGIGATTAIREFEAVSERPAVPIIALTAHAIIGDREKYLAAGLNDYLSKPLRKDTLQEMLDKWLLHEGGHDVRQSA